jgi:hypothetical protein
MMNMRSIKVRQMSYLPLAALILSGSSLMAAPSAPSVGLSAAQSETAAASAQASHLLEEIRLIAHDLRRDAATLESFKRSLLGWESHSHQLALAKEHINSIGARLEKLKAIRNTAEPWQQKAVDSIVPVAVQLALRTEEAISHVNNNSRQLFDPAYTNNLSAIAENADQIRQSAGLFLDLGSAENKLDRLQNRVAATESSS